MHTFTICSLGYKWLKYMPASIIKTAQTAEWKMQGWKIGKPPTIPWEGIGFDVNSAKAANPSPGSASALAPQHSNSLEIPDEVRPSSSSADSRPSINSSEYDDLADFDGRFASSTTLANPNGAPVSSTEHPVKKKNSFLSLFENKQRRQPSVSTITRSSTTRSEHAPSGRVASASSANDYGELRTSQSRTSLKGRPSLAGKKNKSSPPIPSQHEAVLPPLPVAGDLSFNFPTADESTDTSGDWRTTLRGNAQALNKQTPSNSIDRSNGRRSLSHSPMPRSHGVVREKLHLPPLPPFAANDNGPPSPTLSQASHTPSLSARSYRSAGGAPSFQAFSAFGGSERGTNGLSPSLQGSTFGGAKKSKDSRPGISHASALMRASHAEALKGSTQDLLAILERPGARPWGFSYTDVRKHVKVWYGDKDERIGMGSVRWMEKTMKDCEVKIIKGEGHGLLTNAEVVIEVLENIAAEWKRG